MEKKDKRVLDVRCDVGQVVIKLTKDGLKSVGINVSPISIKLAVEDSKKNPRDAFNIASFSARGRRNIFSREIGKNSSA